MRSTKVLIVVLAILLLSATPVFADTPDPDSPPTVEEINVYRNTIETGDWLVLIYANIPYSSTPNTSMTQTFTWRMIDLDDVTELGNTVGYSYNDDGYGYNVYSMYWSASEVVANGMLPNWGASFTLQLAGNPAVFDTPPIYNFTINAADYSTLTVRADVQAELVARILTLAGSLNNRWGLPTVYSLLTQNETATVLSIYGEAFFRGAIHGLNAMAPGVFSVVMRVIEIIDRTWTENYTGNLTGQWSGVWIDTAKAAGQALFGTTYDLLSIIILLVMCGGLMIGNIMLTGDHWNALVDCALLGVIGARLGMYDLGFLILVAAMCSVYISAKIWYGLIK